MDQRIRNKLGNKITFKIQTGYFLEILAPETLKLLGNTKNKIIRERNGKNVSHFTEVVLVYSNIVKNVL